jgi:hypothetical protein
MSAYLGGALGSAKPAMISSQNTDFTVQNYANTDQVASNLGLHKPNVNPVVFERFGNNELTGLMSFFKGYTEERKDNMKYTHFEADFIHGIVYAAYTTSGSLTGGTFTLAADAKTTVGWRGADGVYVGGTGGNKTVAKTVPQVGDLLQAPGRVELLVTAVAADKLTFDAFTTDGSVLGTIANTAEIIIKGSHVKEGSTQSESRNSTYITYQNTMLNHRRDHKVTGTEAGEATWMEFKGENGETKNLWYLKGIADEKKRFLNEREMMLFDSKQVTSEVITQLSGFESITGTEGLIETIATSGNNVDYGAGLTLGDVDSMNDELIKWKANTTNTLLEGYLFSKQFNKLWRTGAGMETASANPPVARVELASGNGISDMAINLDFEKVKYNHFTYMAKVTNAFSSPDTFGAVGQGYDELGLVVPMGDAVVYSDMNKGASKIGKTICMNYHVNHNGVSQAASEWMSGYNGSGLATSGEDAWNVHFRAIVGLETVGINRFGRFYT